MKTLAGRIYFRDFASLVFIIISLLAILFVSTGCLSEGSGSEDQTEVVADPEEVPPPPLTTPERTVCDPFDAGVSARDRGLVGHLLYLTDDQPRYSSAIDVIENGQPIQSTLYFDRLHVPTRSWDLGFYTQDGQLVLNHNDEPLYEYFGLRLESQLMLSASQEPGWYQMAALSDDGAIISRKNADGSLTAIVNNDGTHPTRMGCAGEAIYLDHDSKIPIVVEYHQGPRYHISMVALWRKIGDSEDPSAPDVDSQCGRQGNSMYFDYRKIPSEPTPVYYELLARGWEPLDNENYFFPEQASNPCAGEDPMLITNFSVNSVTRTDVTISWTTSLPATSSAEVKNVISGDVIVAPEDSSLKTNHSVTITGLSSNTLYSVKGISVSAGGQRVESSESAFRTPR